MKHAILLLTALAILLTGTAADTWTILIYGHGDHDLSASLADDIRKMEQIDSTDSFRVLLQADFNSAARKENTACGLPEELSAGVTRFLLKKNGAADRITSKPVMRLPELNMDDPEVLLDFLNWGIKKYPADHYGVIFWDHGGQWQGFGGDSRDGTVESPGTLRPAQIAEVLTRAAGENGVKIWDFAGFDCCLMGGIEVLESFQGVCKCLIACPEVDFGDGWNYAQVLGWLKKHPGAAMTEFGKAEVKSWAELHLTASKIKDLALAAHACYDMARYPAAEAAFTAFAKALSAEFSPQNMIFPRARRLAAEYDISDADKHDSRADYIDLGSFARYFAAGSQVSPALKQRAAELAAAVDALVVAKVIGEEKRGAAGLSVWYPLLPDSRPAAAGMRTEHNAATTKNAGDTDDAEEAGDEEEPDTPEAERQELLEDLDNYGKLRLMSKCVWADYLKRVILADADRQEDQLTLEVSCREPVVRPGGTLTAEVTVKESPGAFWLHGTLLRPLRGHRNKFLSLGEPVSLPLNGSGKYPVQWRAAQLHLTGSGGQSLPLAVFPLNSARDFCFAMAALKIPGKKRVLPVKLLFRISNGKYTLLNLISAGKNRPPAPVKLRKGMTVYAVYPAVIRNGAGPDCWKYRTVIAKPPLELAADGGAGLELEVKPLKPGNYLLALEVENVAAAYSEPLTLPVTVTR